MDISSSFVKVSSQKATNMAERTLEVIRIEREKIDKETLDRYVAYKNRPFLWLFKRKPISRDEAEVLLRKDYDWLGFTMYPSEKCYGTVDMCHKLIWAAKNSSDGFVYISVDDMVQLEPEEE